jgi:DNA repair protein RadC
MIIRKYNTEIRDGQLVLVKESGKRYEAEKLNNPEAIANAMDHIFRLSKKSEEYVYMCCFDIKMNLTGVFEISHGGLSTSFCTPREIYKKALMLNSDRIVLLHNHLTGDQTASKEDIETTK